MLALRRRYPLWGKRKLWRVLAPAHGRTLSESTVGRMVTQLVRLNRVPPVCFYYGRKTQAPAAVYPSCAALALRHEGGRTRRVGAGGP